MLNEELSSWNRRKKRRVEDGFGDWEIIEGGRGGDEAGDQRKREQVCLKLGVNVSWWLSACHKELSRSMQGSP